MEAPCITRPWSTRADTPTFNKLNFFRYPLTLGTCSKSYRFTGIGTVVPTPSFRLVTAADPRHDILLTDDLVHNTVWRLIADAMARTARWASDTFQTRATIDNINQDLETSELRVQQCMILINAIAGCRLFALGDTSKVQFE